MTLPWEAPPICTCEQCVDNADTDVPAALRRDADNVAPFMRAVLKRHVAEWEAAKQEMAAAFSPASSLPTTALGSPLPWASKS